MEANLIHISNDERFIAQVASLSRGNIPSMTDPDLPELIMKLWDWGHMEPFEFIDLTFQLSIPVFLERQLLRHRMSSRMEESMRYTVKESTANLFFNYTLDEENQELVKDSYHKAVETYWKLLDNGVAPEDARVVLPLGIQTHMYVKFNLRSFDNFLKQRLDSHAQWEMRQLAYKMLEELYQQDELIIIYELLRERYKEQIEDIEQIELERELID